MPDWAYIASNKDLIKAFARACARSGLSNSGIVIDPMASVDASEARYFSGVVLARLEGLKPPFQRDETVQQKIVVAVRSVPLSRNLDRYELPSNPAGYQIRRIYYEGRGQWLLEFRGVATKDGDIPLFNADSFVALAIASV